MARGIIEVNAGSASIGVVPTVANPDLLLRSNTGLETSPVSNR